MSKNTIGILDKQLYFGPTFLRGMTYIIFVAIFITIFELIFFVVYLAPMEQNHIIKKINSSKYLFKDDKLQDVDKESVFSIFNIMNENVKTLTQTDIDANVSTDKIHSNVKSYIYTVSDRENELNKKINKDSVAFISLEIVILILFIFIINQSLRTYISTSFETNVKYNTHFGPGIMSPAINALITAIVLAFFQINMYFFALKWKFPSDSEIKYDIVKDLKNHIKSE
jgi:hypothetical protein